VAGGPTYRLWPLLIKTASHARRAWEWRAAGIVALLAVAALCVALILMVEGDDRWIYAVVMWCRWH
jgi:hypothetical protein